MISNWGYKVICELFTNENGRIILIGNFTMWHIGPYSISRPCSYQIITSLYTRLGRFPRERYLWFRRVINGHLHTQTHTYTNTHTPNHKRARTLYITAGEQQASPRTLRVRQTCIHIPANMITHCLRNNYIRLFIHYTLKMLLRRFPCGCNLNILICNFIIARGETDRKTSNYTKSNDQNLTT